jgi:hypothetical protein
MKYFLCVLFVVGIISGADAAQVNCKKVKQQFHQADGNLDDYIQSYPRELQHAILMCLKPFSKNK